MANKEKKCKDCGKLASEVKQFVHSKDLCITCNNRDNYRKRVVAKREKKTVNSAEAKKDVCVNCGVAASEVKVFNYKRELCSKCNLKTNYGTSKSNKKESKGAAKLPIIPVVPSKPKEDEVYEFIDSQGLPYLEGSIVARICNYHSKGTSLYDLQEAFYHLSILVEKEAKKLGRDLVIKE